MIPPGRKHANSAVRPISAPSLKCALHIGYSSDASLFKEH